MLKKVKNQPKKIISRYPLVELTSFCMSTSFEEKTKIEKTHFFVHFQMFFRDFRREITEKGLKLTKKVENS